MSDGDRPAGGCVASGNVLTTDATQTVVLSWTPPLNTTSRVTATVVRQHTTGTTSRTGITYANIRRGSGNPSAPDGSTTIHDLGNLSSTVTIGTSGTEVQVRVVGQVGKTIRWAAWLEVHALEQIVTES